MTVTTKSTIAECGSLVEIVYRMNSSPLFRVYYLWLSGDSEQDRYPVVRTGACTGSIGETKLFFTYRPVQGVRK